MSRVSSLWHTRFFDSVPQSRSYRFFLLALAFISLIFACFRKTGDKSATANSGQGLSLGGLTRWTPWLAGLLFLYPVLFGKSLTTMGAGGAEVAANVAESVAMVLFLSGILRSLPRRIINPILGTLIVGYVVALLAPGFFSPLSLDSDVLLEVDWHFDAVVGGAEQLRDGLHAFTDICPLYGLMGPGFIAILEKLTGHLDFSAHIRLIQISQAAFLIIALVNCWIWMPRSRLFAVTAALLVGPFLGSSHAAILFPNQSGWRYLGMALAILLLLLGRRMAPKKHVFLLGLLVGILNLHSPEISIAVLGSFLAFLVTASGTPLRLRLPPHLVFFGMGIVVAWAAYFVVHRIAFGAFPAHAYRVFGTILLVANTGFSGIPLYFDPAFVFIVTLGAYRCSSLFLKAVRQGLSSRDQVVFAVSVMSLVWLAYFVNRADHWNLWAQLYLMLFLLPRGLFAMPGSALGPRLPFVSLSTREIHLRFTRAICLYALFLGPLIIHANRSYFLTPPMMKPQPGASASTGSQPLVSGLVVSPHASDLLRQRCGYLMAHKDQTRFCVTKLPFSTRLLAGSPGNWVTNPFIHWSREDFPHFVTNVLHRSPDLILFDSPDDGLFGSDPTAEKTWQSLCALFRKKISGRYQQTQTKEGWEIWEKVPNSAAE